ncbi:uncharacterized protein N0V89_000030 [Didymosphaeria variabile]|uniref:Major facilitator superfamily (MFS) profile domain-containing protein n=1 Tax=Didymosphaeria variabile TaxID=1932322 RepID=A0A9W8XUH1_9PLEO|nr:uncharacterized protein N0V89_000030 [Didymosphaeria variabile]KAJ4359476.1 hypothetical protein N0V89_000030 [Didymosphaeria variabile]
MTAQHALSSALHPPRYVLASILAGVGGFLFGLDTGTIGPVTAMSQFSDTFGELSATVHGLIVSSILITGALSSFMAGHLADTVGRPLGMAIGAAVFGAGAAIEAGSVHLAMLFIGRFITGAGEGLFLSTTVVYICEIVPAKGRGVIASAPQFFITFALVVGYFFCYGTVNIESSLAWRLPFAFHALCAFTWGALVVLFLPHSPRWLKAKGRMDEVDDAWEKLGIRPGQDLEDAEARELETEAGLNMEPLALRPTTTRQTVREDVHMLLRVFTKDARKPTALGVFMMSMMQLSGIDGVLYYAPLLFQQAGLVSESSSFLASGLSGVVIFATTIPAILLADRWSRRASVIYGGFVLTAVMLVIGALYAANAVHSDRGAARWVVVVFIFLFTFVYSGTWAVTISIYASEVQPMKTRAAASSLGRSGNWIVNWIVAFTTPIFLTRSSCGVYFLFGGCCFVTSVVCFLWMPETRGLSLEEIDDIFDKGKKSKASSRVNSVVNVVLGRGEKR